MTSIPKETFYITTAIDYPNGSPHIGHAYEKIATDAYARWYRLMGRDVYYLTGTDENGQKLVESAQAQGKETGQFVSENAEIFKSFCERLNNSHNDFIRTTEERHKKICQELWKKIEAKGDIYHGHYSGQYCISCETFYTESQAPDNICPEHGVPLKLKEEEGYFFKMSRYKDWIIDHLKTNPDFIVPKKSYNEILSRLQGDDLRDLAISRPNTMNWGIPVPGNNNFVMYTWFDALINYYSGIVDKGLEEKYWPADVHVIGKDIIWFHTVIWPIMLHVADIPLPHQVYVHGMVLGADGRKMSKSLGNVINPHDMLEKYPLDTFRYYILRAISAQSDGAFSEQELIDKHNNELGNDFGNLIMRVVKLAQKVQGSFDPEGVTQDFDLKVAFELMSTHMDKREHNKALDVLWERVNALNQYVNTKEPWKLKTDPEAFKPVAYNCLYGIHVICILLSAFLPDTALKAASSLGICELSIKDREFGKATYQLSTPEPLFPKIEA